MATLIECLQFYKEAKSVVSTGEQVRAGFYLDGDRLALYLTFYPGDPDSPEAEAEEGVWADEVEHFFPYRI